MIDVVMLPAYLDRGALGKSQVVVLDVLRATSTMVTALAHGAREVRLFGEVAEAKAARAAVRGPAVLGGERGGVKIAGFDLGNSPAEYGAERIGGATVLLTTTNGTLAAVAAQGAREVFAGSLLNAGITAQALLPGIGKGDTVLLCAGTEGRISSEDVIGAGAILFQIMQQTMSPALPFTDTAWIAYQTFSAVRQHLPAALRLGQGGINLIELGMEDDIDRCAVLDGKSMVVKIERGPLRAVRG